MEAIVFLVHGWTGTPERSLSGLQTILEMIPGIRVVKPLYMDVKGPCTKWRTRKSINFYADVVEAEIEKLPTDVPIIGVGHSMGAIILRLLHNRGHNFNLPIFAAGPHKGVSPLVGKLVPVAQVMGVRPLLEMAPESQFLKSLGTPPPGIYIGGREDILVPLHSAIPVNNGVIVECGHSMFPNEFEKMANSAIPVVVEAVFKEVYKNDRDRRDSSQR